MKNLFLTVLATFAIGSMAQAECQGTYELYLNNGHGGAPNSYGRLTLNGPFTRTTVSGFVDNFGRPLDQWVDVTCANGTVKIERPLNGGQGGSQVWSGTYGPTLSPPSDGMLNIRSNGGRIPFRLQQVGAGQQSCEGQWQISSEWFQSATFFIDDADDAGNIRSARIFGNTVGGTCANGRLVLQYSGDRQIEAPVTVGRPEMNGTMSGIPFKMIPR